jgi:hypothetical protein
LLVALTLALACCGSQSVTVDGGPRGDAGPRDAGARDAGPPCDLTDDSPPYFTDRGECFEQTPPCCSDADCSSDFFGCFLDPVLPAPRTPGRCRAWEVCTCASDSDCEPGAICVTNQSYCGACVVQTLCTSDRECAAGRTCVGGLCTETCPP